MKKNIKIIGIVVALVIVASVYFLWPRSTGESSAIQNITIGSKAPENNFLLDNGTYVNISKYRGHPVVLWFVATWCSTCAQGNQVLNGNYQFFKKHGIDIVELELYKDLGYQGPTITNFISSYAPEAYANGTIIPALSGNNMTLKYDPKGYLDIYYLVSGNGTVEYISGEPALTLGQLKNAINNSL